MNIEQLVDRLDDGITAQQRIAVAVQDLAAAVEQLVEFIVMRPTENDEGEKTGCGW